MKPALISLGIICLATAAAWGVSEFSYKTPPANAPSEISEIPSLTTLQDLLQNRSEPGFAGSFLAAQFAQHQQKWTDATYYLGKLKAIHPLESAVLKQTMVLEMGAGNAKPAVEAAQEVLNSSTADEANKTLASLFVITGAFIDEDYIRAEKVLNAMPKDQLAIFMKPLLTGWIDAAQGKYTVKNMDNSLLYVMHALYIADFLGDKETTKSLLAGLSRVNDLSTADLETLGDIYAYLGEIETAEKTYDFILQYAPTSQRIKTKRENVRTAASSYYAPFEIPAHGLAQTFYDIAIILQRDLADDSAHIFANMALSLNPDHEDAHILLAILAARYGHEDEAIKHYSAIPKSSPLYLEAQRAIANTYEDANKPDDAIKALEKIYNEYGDLESLIQVGDVQRRQEHFKQAIKTYDKAQEIMGGSVTPEYWRLHYTRGMAHERAGNWPLAEADLKAALIYQPNHPYILNYLGYAWADQGINMQAALTMVKAAHAAQPKDGYITDSLGWIYYKIGKYEDAVPYLEEAIELVPSDATINDHLGDAYWQVGRKFEARYEWKRALSYAKNNDDQILMETIEDKIENGLHNVEIIEITEAPATPENAASGEE